MAVWKVAMAKRTPASPTGSPRKRATSKKPNGAADTPVATLTPPEPSEEDIRIRAYHRYLERGASQGRDFDDWLEAEKDLKPPRS
jgi:hypothetical protein